MQNENQPCSLDEEKAKNKVEKLINSITFLIDKRRNKMENKNVFENENVKLRLIDLEYDYKQKFASINASEVKEAKVDFEADVRRIYKEETHHDLPENIKIEIYTSNELVNQNTGIESSTRESGYDGTAIHIDKKNISISFILFQKAVLIIRIGRITFWSF